MRNSKILIFIFYGVLLITSSCTSRNNTDKFKSDLVDMFMGVQGFSNCVIGPQLPHGSINPSPQTPNGHHDGYHPSEPIRGFGQLHSSGTGWGRYGQVFISPQIGFNANEDGHDSQKSDEHASPYYYKVHLDRYNIKTEITPTANCAYYRFTFPKSEEANILLDIAHNIPQHIVPFVNGQFLGGEIFYNRNALTLSGWGEYVGGFGNDKEPYRVYYNIVFDKEPTEVLITNKQENALYAQIKLPQDPDIVHMKVAVSMKSIENAHRFLKEEIANNSFEAIKLKALQTWEDVFASIDVRGGNDYDNRIFYTTMYHSFIMPRNRTGDNPYWESTLSHFDDHYCVWDTWRTKYPLMLLIQESFVAETINSFIDRFENQGVVRPTYTSSLVWDWKQGGDDIDNIIADAFVKGVTGFNRKKAYELIKFNAFNERSRAYIQNGWEPEPAERMSCSYTMEYAYNDFCASAVAEILNDTSTAIQLKERSKKWIYLFNNELDSHGFKGFVAPRKKNGEWITIDPTERYGSWVEYFYEGNSWVYTLFTPHQFDTLIEMCGGKDMMIKRLIYGFENDLIELDNEPGFLSPFIFTHCKRPDLTAKYVNMIRQNHFSLETGYPENEDSGAMGSWYVFTSIGIFPNAGQDFYYLIPPAFDEITITRENGKKIQIKTVRKNPEANNIESVVVNGKKLDAPIIRHADISEGANIIYNLQ